MSRRVVALVALTLAHPTVDRVCGLAYGFDVPPGWTPGMVTCGPEGARPVVDGD